MYLRRCYRKKDGKRHAYWALVESYRTARGPRQRVVAWLGAMDEQGRLGVKRCAERTAAQQGSLFRDPAAGMGGSGCEARSCGTQPEVRRPLAGAGVAAPAGTGSLSGRDAARRAGRDSLAVDGHGAGARAAVRCLQRVAPGGAVLRIQRAGGSAERAGREGQRGSPVPGAGCAAAAQGRRWRST